MMHVRALRAPTLHLWSRHARRVPPTAVATAAAPRRAMSNDSKMAEKMRDELAGVMKKKNIAAATGEKPPPPKGFIHFIKTNKTQFLNIGASFFCVLLAYQIVALRRSGRYRQRQLDETRDELSTKQSLLQSLTSDEFVTRMATECAAMVLLEENAKRKWSIGNRQLSEEELAEKLHPVIDLLLNERIGDAGLTEEQKKEKNCRGTSKCTSITNRD